MPKYHRVTYRSSEWPDDPRAQDPAWPLCVLASKRLEKIVLDLGSPKFWIPTAQLLLNAYLEEEKLIVAWMKRGLEYVNREHVCANAFLELYLDMVQKLHILPFKVQTRNEKKRVDQEGQPWYQDMLDAMSDDEYDHFTYQSVEEGEVLVNNLACTVFLEEIAAILVDVRSRDEAKGAKLMTTFREQYFDAAKSALKACACA